MGYCRVNGDLMLSMINDILDFGQMNMNKINLLVGNFKLGKMIEEVEATMSILAGLRNIKLIF